MSNGLEGFIHGKYLYIDLETTGLDPKRCSPYSVVAYAEINGKIVEGFQMNVRPFPGDEIDDKALEVSGKTKEEIVTLKDPVQGYRVFLSFLNKHINKYDKTDKFTIVAYNSTFDSSFLREFFKKADPYQGAYFGSYFRSYTIDVYTITALMQMLGKFNLPNLKLQTVANHFGFEFTAHQAMDDILVTRKIFYRCLRELCVIPDSVVVA